MKPADLEKRYGPLLAPLLGRADLCSLGPGQPSAKTETSLTTLDTRQLVPGKPVRDAMMANCVMAALWLYHDFLDKSHRISQSIPTPTGSFLHGIMHRREGDYSNAKYWFARVGEHPVDRAIETEARAVLSAGGCDGKGLAKSLLPWRHEKFVDVVASVIHQGSASERICQEIQDLEWWCVFDFAFRKAHGDER